MSTASGDRRSCGGGCLRAVAGVAVIAGLLVLYQPLHAQVSARLASPDYATGILTVSGGLALALMAGVALAGLMSLVAFSRKQPGFGIGSGLLALICLVIALSIGTQTWHDVVSTPAVARGTVTYHFVNTRRGYATYYVRQNGTDYTATAAVYGKTVDGRCAVLTYGPSTKVVTATAPCGP